MGEPDRGAQDPDRPQADPEQHAAGSGGPEARLTREIDRLTVEPHNRLLNKPAR